MADSTTDLIQRAAARLEKVSAPIERATAPAAASIIERAHPQELPGAAPVAPIAPVATVAPVRREAVYTTAPVRSRSVTLSSTGLAANGIVLPGGAYSRTVEEFRAIKRHVLANAQRARAAASPEASRVVLVTSARPGDGKTFAAINLALALAYEKDIRVLLFDADAYRQSLLQYLGITAEAGWIDVVSAASIAPGERVLQTNVPNLEVLPAGKERPEIPELMSSRHMKRLLDELVRQDPDRYIIIDSLPCLTSTEPSILTALAGQTLFVVAAHKTSRDEIDSSLRLLNMSPSVNLILNKAEPLLSEQFKGYEQGYGQQQ